MKKYLSSLIDVHHNSLYQHTIIQFPSLICIYIFIWNYFWNENHFNAISSPRIEMLSHNNFRCTCSKTYTPLPISIPLSLQILTKLVEAAVLAASWETSGHSQRNTVNCVLNFFLAPRKHKKSVFIELKMRLINWHSKAYSISVWRQSQINDDCSSDQ